MQKKYHIYTGARLSGLSTEGMILLPIKQSEKVASAARTNNERDHLMAAAREGDEEAIEHLTLEDMDTYSMISRRIGKEDILSIVTTYFMPYGIESDKYSILGNIMAYRRYYNHISMEEVVEYLYNRPCNGRVVIDDTLKAAIDAYYETYGVK